MPRPISHFRSVDDPQNTTLCGYNITRRYNIINPEQIILGIELIYPLCARCRTRAERLELIPRQARQQWLEQPTPQQARQQRLEPQQGVDEDISSSDKQIDIWLLRLGIQ